jgi:iron complex outermembrane receptor protein
MPDLSALSIEELANLEVTSVSKKAEPLSGAPAAIYVITDEDIERMGAITLPEALRLAPNLQVARLDALSYAISARGFNSTEASNKLLVLIDGRSVYSPLHSGVFWDVQNIVMEDIERIEVVGGPGGTLWGANAVNGVINVITKSAHDTQGGLVSASYGTMDQQFTARYGGKTSDAFAYRAYVKGAEFGNSRNPNGSDHIDDWDILQGGVNIDWRGDSDSVRVEGNAYDGGLEVVSSETSGQNIALTWTHDIGGTAPLQFHAYYDRTHRDQPGIIQETVKAYNADVQHGFNVGDAHTIVWGAGYRRTSDTYTVPPPFGVANTHAQRNLWNVFLQDEVALTDQLKVTAGLKIEHHTYTDFEYMPSVRAAWQPSAHDLWWAAVSRAVRTPSRLDRDLQALPILLPAPTFMSETLVAYEAGYRGQLSDSLLVSVSAFFNDYDKLRTTSPLPTGQFRLLNGMEGHVYGVELWAQYRVNEWWRLSAGATGLSKDLKAKPGVIDVSNMQAAGNDPDQQFSVRSLMALSDNVSFDVGLRAVEKLRSPVIRSYVELDARLGWRITDTFELSVAGFNLLHDQHPEGGPVSTRREVRRNAHVAAKLAF